MRPRLFLVLLALGALAALVGVAATFADSPGARPAFALVDPNNGSPRLVAAHTQGFVAVSQGPFGPGDYLWVPETRFSAPTRERTTVRRNAPRRSRFGVGQLHLLAAPEEGSSRNEASRSSRALCGHPQVRGDQWSGCTGRAGISAGACSSITRGG
jgi:hypothetical protein